MISPTTLSRAIDLLEMAEQAHDTAKDAVKRGNREVSLKYYALSGEHSTDAVKLITEHTEQLANEAETIPEKIK